MRANVQRSLLRARTWRYAFRGDVLLPVGGSGIRLCALDGDGTSMCTGNPFLDKVIGYDWSDVPPEHRCLLCDAILSALPLQ